MNARQSSAWLGAVLAASLAPCWSAQLPDLFTSDFDVRLSTNSPYTLTTNPVVAGSEIEVNWLVGGNATLCIPEDNYCEERFGTATGTWEDALFLTNANWTKVLATQSFSGSIPPGGSYTRTVRVRVPPETPSGIYRVAVRVDYLESNVAGRVAEQDENNNLGRARTSLAVVPPAAFALLPIVNNGTVSLTVTAAVATPVRLQKGNQAAGSMWTDMATFPPMTGTVTYLDVNATNASRFYRVVVP